MSTQRGFGKLLVMLVAVIFGIVCAVYLPKNTPPGAQPQGMPGHTVYVADQPHTDDTLAVMLALAVPALIVLVLLWKFLTAPRRNAGLFLMAFLASLVACGWTGCSAKLLEQGGKVPLIAAELPLYVTFGTWAPFYTAAGIGVLALGMALFAVIIPAPKQDRHQDDFESLGTGW